MQDVSTKPAEESQGVRCPKCNCADCKVDRTKHVPKGTLRYRTCRSCGKRFTSYERIGAAR